MDMPTCQKSPSVPGSFFNQFVTDIRTYIVCIHNKYIDLVFNNKDTLKC